MTRLYSVAGVPHDIGCPLIRRLSDLQATLVTSSTSAPMETSRTSSRVYKDFFPSSVEHGYQNTQDSYEEVTSDGESEEGFIETAQEITTEQEVTTSYRDEDFHTSSSSRYLDYDHV